MANTEIVGYQFKQISSNTVIQSWGGTWGQCPGVPPVLRVEELMLDICAPIANTVYGGDYILDYWYMDEPAPAVPEMISDRQFFQQANVSGFITQSEALAAVKTGDIPSTLNTIISALPDGARFNAEMLLSGATVFYRNHPMVEVIRSALNMTEEEIDQFFKDANNL